MEDILLDPEKLAGAGALAGAYLSAKTGQGFISGQREFLLEGYDGLEKEIERSKTRLYGNLEPEPRNFAEQFLKNPGESYEIAGASLYSRLLQRNKESKNWKGYLDRLEPDLTKDESSISAASHGLYHGYEV